MFQLFLTEYEPTYTYINYTKHEVSWEEYKFYLPMAILCMVVAAWMLYTKVYKYSRLKKICNYPVQARMFAVDYKRGGKGGRFWNITYEFFYNEKRYLVNNGLWERLGHYYKPQEGDVVDILINPLDPYSIYDIVVDGGRKTGLFTGPLFAVLGVFMLFIPVIT